MKPDAFHQLDRVIHEKGRLAIMSLLAASHHMSFTEIRSMLGMTDGNLTAHTRTLQQAGYLAAEKTVSGGRPLTTFSLTSDGRRAFARYIDILEQIVQVNKRGVPSDPPDAS